MNISGYNEPEPSYNIGPAELLRRWEARAEASRLAGLESAAELLDTLRAEALSADDFVSGAPTARAPIPAIIQTWIQREREWRAENPRNRATDTLRLYRREAQEALNLVGDPSKL